MELMMISMYALQVVATYMVYQKMNLEGWKSLIPFYGAYVLFEEVYGDGRRMFLTLIPFYGLYVSTRLYMDIAVGFGESTGFGAGMYLLPALFMSILAFSNDKFYYGSMVPVSEQQAQKQQEREWRAEERRMAREKAMAEREAARQQMMAQREAARKAAAAGSICTRPAPVQAAQTSAVQKLKEYNELREMGILTEEEFQQKKAELLEKI